MYLRDSDEAEVLLRLIDDCDRLVEANTLSKDAAYTIISEAAKHHTDHPGERRKVSAAYEAKHPTTAIQSVIPAPVQPPMQTAEVEEPTIQF